MYIKVYFTIKDERATDYRDFYKFSKTQISGIPDGMPLFLGGCVLLDKSDVDACRRLFKSYMKDAKEYINTRWRNRSMTYRNKKQKNTDEAIIEEFYERMLET